MLAFARNSISNLELGSNVTTIGTKAFIRNNLQSVTLPNSLIQIGENAFSSNDIRTISIPNSVTTIGNNAFNYNSNLTSASIDNSIGNITLGQDSFGSVTPTYLR